jgi:hypothetical protein
VTSLRLYLAVCVCLVGCAAETTSDSTQALSSSPGDVAATIRFAPIDLTTAAGQRAGVVLLFDRELDASFVSDFERRLRLVEWPERTSVPSRVVYVAAQISRGDSSHRFEVEPISPLGNRWYALELDLANLPGNAPVPDVLELADDTIVSRFRPDSHPIALAAQIQAEDDEVTMVDVEFSERVLAPGPAMRLLVNGTEVDCRSLSTAARGDDAPDLEDAQLHHVFRCAGLLSGHLEMEFDPALRTVFGTPAHGPDDRTPVRFGWEAPTRGGRVALGFVQ